MEKTPNWLEVLSLGLQLLEPESWVYLSLLTAVHLYSVTLRGSKWFPFKKKN